MHIYSLGNRVCWLSPSVVVKAADATDGGSLWSCVFFNEQLI